jgi:hypothetical protein
MFPYNVHPAAVHEHRRQDGDPTPAIDNIGGDHRPLFYKFFSASQLKYEEDGIQHDDGGRHERKI